MPRKSPQLSGQSTDHIHRCIQHHADNIYLLLFVRQTHPSDHIGAVLMKQGIDLFRLTAILNNDADHGNSCTGFLHNNHSSLLWTNISITKKAPENLDISPPGALSTRNKLYACKRHTDPLLPVRFSFRSVPCIFPLCRKNISDSRRRCMKLFIVHM